MQLLSPIQSYTPSQQIEHIGNLCRPLLDEIHLQYPSINLKWAGICGPVKRSRIYGGINIFIAVSLDATRDRIGQLYSWRRLRDRLLEVLDSKVKITIGVQHEIYDLDKIKLLLIGKTIWGDVSWLG